MIGGDLKTEGGISSFNDYLADKSYVEGFQPSQADTTVFNAIHNRPNAKYPHFLRWYNHINSYGSAMSSFPGVKKDISAFVTSAEKSTASKPDSKAAGDDDDDLDLFGSDEDAEAEKVKEERRKQYQDKKAKKPGVIAKSTVLLDVKPWDDETDMAEMEKRVRTIEMEGLKWGASKLVPLAFGIKKLQIVTVVEDEKVSIDMLQEEIEKIEDLVQSVDIAAFQKI